MASRNPPEPDSLTLYEKQSELKRVLDSRYFAKAPKRRRFLEFTSGQVFLGEDSKLNEYLIGVEVYDRGEDFNPQQDPIVRVQAHEIRRVLKNYYQEEGKNSLVRVELHPGHYAPVFRRVKIDSEEPATPAVQEESPAADFKRQTSHWQHAVIVSLSLACATLGLLFLRERSSSRQPPESRALAAALPESEEWFWKPFLGYGTQPLVIVPTPPLLRLGADGDSPQTLRDGYAIPKSKMPEFHDTIHFREMRSFIFVPTTTDYMGIGGALGLLNLSRLFAGQGMMIRVKTARLTNFTEIQGGNTIFLGGSNQWTDRVFPNAQGFSVSEGVFKNNSPRPGEQSLYRPNFDPITNHLIRDYALVLMLPNQAKGERLLFLDGVYTQGVQAAAEYVTNAERLAELRKALLAASPDKKTTSPFFEALLSVPVENYVPGGASLVAVRIIRE
jgi:hypothetical protein